MSIRFTALFPGEDQADLAVMSLRSHGCEVISRETHDRLPPRLSNEAGIYGSFSPLPLQDGGTLWGMRLPGMPRFSAFNALDDREPSSGGVVLNLRVPDEKADFAEKHLYNQGASRVRRLG